MSKVDQKGVFLERLFSAVVSIVTTSVGVRATCEDEEQREESVKKRVGTVREIPRSRYRHATT